MSSLNAFNAAMNRLLKHEGGYVDDPDDPGGATNLGITRKTLAEWRGIRIDKWGHWRAHLPKSEVKNLTVREATEIYKARYWDSVRADELPPGLAYAMFDFAVNSGPRQAIKELQRSLGVTADGLIGGMTLAALKRKSNNYPELIEEVSYRRITFMRKLKNWWKYKNGWTRRVNEVLTTAIDLQLPFDLQP